MFLNYMNTSLKLLLVLLIIVLVLAVAYKYMKPSYPLLLGASMDAEENLIGDYSTATLGPSNVNFSTALALAKSKNVKYMMLGGGYVWSFNVLIQPYKNPSLFISPSGLPSFNNAVGKALGCWVGTEMCGCGFASGDDCPNTSLIPPQPTHQNSQRVWVIYQLY